MLVTWSPYLPPSQVETIDLKTPEGQAVEEWAKGRYWKHFVYAYLFNSILFGLC